MWLHKCNDISALGAPIWAVLRNSSLVQSISHFLFVTALLQQQQQQLPFYRLNNEDRFCEVKSLETCLTLRRWLDYLLVSWLSSEYRIAMQNTRFNYNNADSQWTRKIRGLEENGPSTRTNCGGDDDRSGRRSSTCVSSCIWMCMHECMRAFLRGSAYCRFYPACAGEKLASRVMVVVGQQASLVKFKGLMKLGNVATMTTTNVK